MAANCLQYFLLDLLTFHLLVIPIFLTSLKLFSHKYNQVAGSIHFAYEVITKFTGLKFDNPTSGSLMMVRKKVHIPMYLYDI